LQITETNKAVAADQQLTLASERDRAEALARKLTSAKEELEAGKQRIAALSAVRARHSSGPAACSPQERTVSELPAPETPSATHEATSNFIPRASVGTERSTSVSAAPSSLVDGPNWIIAETTSLVDHKPQIAALTTAQASSKDAPYSLTIYCRHDRTGLTITASSSWKQSTDGEIKVVYQINEEPSVEQRWRASESGRSLDFSGDVVRLLRSMPDTGRMLFRVYAGEDLLPEITFQLAGLDSVRRKIAAACDWPQP
jgi:hypothetical protein